MLFAFHVSLASLMPGHGGEWTIIFLTLLIDAVFWVLRWYDNLLPNELGNFALRHLCVFANQYEVTSRRSHSSFDVSPRPILSARRFRCRGYLRNIS
jgi:hypothetical protein